MDFYETLLITNIILFFGHTVLDTNSVWKTLTALNIFWFSLMVITR